MQDEQLRREEEKEEGVQMSTSSPMSCFSVPSLVVTCTFLLGTVPNCLCWLSAQHAERTRVNCEIGDRKGGEKEVKERELDVPEIPFCCMYNGKRDNQGVVLIERLK